MGDSKKDVRGMMMKNIKGCIIHNISKAKKSDILLLGKKCETGIIFIDLEPINISNYHQEWIEKCKDKPWGDNTKNNNWPKYTKAWTGKENIDEFKIK